MSVKIYFRFIFIQAHVFSIIAENSSEMFLETMKMHQIFFFSCREGVVTAVHV